MSNNQNVTVNYLGYIQTFSQTDFTSGNFNNWISQIQIQAANQPCDEMLTQTQTTQNSIITQNLISTLTSITAASTMSVTSVGSSISNSVDNSSSNNSPSSRRGSNNNNQNNGTTNQSNNTSSGSVSSSSTTTNGGAQPSSNTGSSQPNSGGNNNQGEGTNQNGGNTSGSGNSTEGGSGQAQPPVNNPPSNPPSSGNSSGNNTGQGGGGNTPSGTNPTDGPKQENTGGGAGGTTNSVANAAEATSSSSSSSPSGGSKVRVGSLIGTGDIVAIRSAEDKSNQFKGTMSMTKSNTNNTFAKGFLLNFTTTINNTSLTFYGARSNKLKTNTFIFANSSMIDFERNFFNTTTVMDSKRFGKLSMMGGLNFTVGGLSGELFGNVSAVGGGFYPFKVGKKLTGNMLMLGVYSPFTQFYEGKWWDSGILLVPFSSWDYTISKNFKYNVSLSGTYQVNGNVLNYQILTGGKILL